MQVNHSLSDIDVALLVEALGRLEHARSHELLARLVQMHGQANQQAMAELSEYREQKAKAAAQEPSGNQ